MNPDTAQIQSLSDFFLDRLPKDHLTYAFTIVPTREVAWKKQETSVLVASLYQKICQRFVHKRRAASPATKHLMPFMLAVLETDDKVLCHVHALIAVHPDITEKFDALAKFDSFREFDARVLNSCIQRTIADPVPVNDYETQTNVRNWMNYCIKQKNVVHKTSDDLLFFGPKQ